MQTRSPRSFKNIRQNLDWWSQHRDQAVHLKFSVHGRIVGVVLVKNFWNLCNLFVAPAQHGQGIGRALTFAAIERCRGKTERPALRLNSSRNAVGFYEGIGFVRTVTDTPPPQGCTPLEHKF
ncbi:GNAT family N-acetyltransferase [Undibacterium arcticum]